MNKPYHFLWTGGWDSTFRVIQLYKRGITIQPIYVKDHNRRSTKKEIETIELLTQQIQERFKDSKGKILALKTIKRRDIPKDLFLKLMFKIIKRKQRIGKQYLWLAYLSKEYKGLEQAFHKEDRDQLIKIENLLEIEDETGGRNWIINPKKVDFFRRQIFKNTRFPLVYISKLEMKKEAEDNDYIDIMNNSWFCHLSNEKPCGKCTPCKQYVIDGMRYRLN